jgi:hypothetical protein
MLQNILKKTLVLVPLLILGVFFISQNALAVTVETYPVGTSNLNLKNDGGFHSQKYEFTAQTVFNTNVLTDTLTVETYETSTCFKTSACQIGLYNAAGTNLSFFNFQSTSTLNGNTFLTTYHVNTTITTTAATHYWLAGDDASVTGARSPSTTYVNGDSWDTSCHGGSVINCSAGVYNSDFYFGIKTNPTAGANSFIQFDGTPTSTCQMSSISVTDSYSPTDLAACIASNSCSQGVAFSIFSSSTYYPFNQNTGVFGQGLNNASETFQVPLHMTFTTNSIVYARAYLCSKNTLAQCELDTTSNPNILDYSDEWSFVVDPFGSCVTTTYSQSEITPRFNTSTLSFLNNLTNIANTKCDELNHGVSGPIVWGLCKALVFTFVPGNAILNDWANLRTAVANKPPFGYYSAYSSSLASLSSATSTTSTIATSSAVFVSNVQAYTAGYTWYTTFMTIIRALLWISFGFAIYRFFKRFTPNS